MDIRLCWLAGIVALASASAEAQEEVAEPGPFASFAAASAPELNDPHDLAFGPDGRLYIADKFGARIVVMDPDTLEIVEVIGEGTLPGIHDISFGPQGQAVVAVTGLNAVALYQAVGDTLIAAGMMGGFARTEGALAHSNGRIYVMASGTGQLVALEDGLAVVAVAGMPGAHDVAEAPDGSVWVADNFSRRLVHFTPNLELIKIIEGPEYGFVGPRYLDIDEFGRLVVADQDAHRVLLIEPITGALLGVIGDGTPGEGPGKFDDPEGVAVRGSQYFFSDSDNNRIVRYEVVVN